MLIAAIIAADDPDFSVTPVAASPLAMLAAIVLELPGQDDADRVAAALDHDQTLAVYADGVSLGLSCREFRDAAQAYFGRPPEALTLAETAWLAGIARVPASYHPLRFPERELERRDAVLDGMLAAHVIGEAEAAEARAQPLTHRTPLARCN